MQQSDLAWQYLTGAVLAAAVAAVTCVLLPPQLWHPLSFVAAALLGLSLCVPALANTALQRFGHRANEATFIWLIGPLGALAVVLFLLGAASFALSLVHHHARLAMATDIVWVATLLIGALTLKAATPVVSEASQQLPSAAADPRTAWAGILRSLAADAQDPEARSSLLQLEERVRLSSNETPSHITSQSEEITALLQQIRWASDSAAAWPLAAT